MNVRTQGAKRFIIAPDGTGIPIPRHVRDPGTGKSIPIPWSAECTVKQDRSSYLVTIHCFPGKHAMTGEGRAMAAGAMQGAVGGGVRVGARIVGAKPAVGFLAAQVIGRALAGCAAMLVFPDALNAGSVNYVHCPQMGRDITYVIFSE